MLSRGKSIQLVYGLASGLKKSKLILELGFWIYGKLGQESVPTEKTRENEIAHKEMELFIEGPSQ